MGKRRKGKKVLCMLLTAAMLTVFSAATVLAREAEDGLSTAALTLTGIRYNMDSLVFTQAGQTETLTLLPTPADAVLGEYTFESSDPKVASVDEGGKVTPVGNGQARITSAVQGLTASCEVTVAFAGMWKEDGTGRRYIRGDGSSPSGVWEFIDRHWYAFDQKGYARTGWYQERNTWYYLHSDGAMAVGWEKIGNTWYYLNSNGKMATGWLKEGNTWYYLGGSGAMATGWLRQGSVWYYLNSSGKMVTGWLKEGNTWYYLSGSGAMSTGWLKEGNTCYYLRANGSMVTGWQLSGGKWYYLRQNGAMATGWEKTGNTWYYLKSDGAMATGWLKLGNTWYYLKSSGAMATDWLKLGNTWYYLKSSGAMATGWLKLGNTWYYLNGNGAMATGWLKLGNTWYYLKSSGAMASDEWIGKYYVDQNGVWVQNQTKGIKVAIDAGHQRKGNSQTEPIGPGSSIRKPKVSSGTSGCVSGLEEYELNLQVSLKLRDELRARGYEVYMIRETHDVNISNAERAKMAANADADILVRIHANSDSNSSVNGALTMAPSKSNRFVKNISGDCIRLSQSVIDSFCASTGAKNRGILTSDDMSGINWSTIPVTIVEMGFMSNPAEDRKMAAESYQNKMVKGIADGIDKYFSK